MTNEQLIALLSLLVALLAVFIGPLVSWLISKRQITSSLEVANKQIIAPMRQAWINSLRDLLSEISSSALHYYVTGFEERTDDEYRKLTLLEHKIVLMMNAEENDHKELLAIIRKMISALEKGKEGDDTFVSTHTKLLGLSQKIIKREWNRVKDKIPAK